MAAMLMKLFGMEKAAVGVKVATGAEAATGVKAATGAEAAAAGTSRSNMIMIGGMALPNVFAIGSKLFSAYSLNSAVKNITANPMNLAIVAAAGVAAFVLLKK